MLIREGIFDLRIYVTVTSLYPLDQGVTQAVPEELPTGGLDIELMLYLTPGGLELLHLLLAHKFMLFVMDYGLCLSNCRPITFYSTLCAFGNEVIFLKIIC